MNGLNSLITEQQNIKSLHIDEMSTSDILKTINNEDQGVAVAVEKEIPMIVQAVDAIYERVSNGGRLIYIGAGTSGRLGVLDASECPPTYGVDPHLVQGLIAGGSNALQQAIEGAEDSEELAYNDLKNIQLTDRDVVCGLAASGRTPYVKGGLEYGKRTGSLTVSICCVKKGYISQFSQYPIEVLVGPEVITGSTRMKAGTAQKMVLNMISTSLMIKMGKVYGNLMVDVQPTNEKLKKRAIHIVEQAIDCDMEIAQSLLKESQYDVKIAILMGLTGNKTNECLALLQNNNGNISKTVKTLKR